MILNPRNRERQVIDNKGLYFVLTYPMSNDFKGDFDITFIKKLSGFKKEKKMVMNIRKTF